MNAWDVSKYKSLPPVGSHQIDRFRGGKYGKITYLELLGTTYNGQEIENAHGCVFKVRIGTEIFALKVVSLLLTGVCSY